MKKWFVLIGLAAFLEASYLYYSYTMLGFPDGHLTDLERVYKTFYPVFFCLFLILSILSLVGLKKSLNLKTVWVFLFLLILLSILYFGFDIYFSNIYDNGRGG